MRRLRGSRGATMVEYGLIAALLVGVSIGAIEVLTEESTEETQQQAECISERPPPLSCQIPTAATTTSTTTGGPTTTSPSTLPATTVVIPPSQAVVGAQPPATPGAVPGSWVVTPPVITVQTGDAVPFPVAGAIIRFALEVEDPSNPGVWISIEVGSCTTNSSGECSSMPSFEVLAANYTPPITNARIVVTDIQSNPAVTPLPGPFTYTLA